METSAKTVAIIGAGSSGCCAAKYCIENGLSPTIYEKSKYPGGLWASSGTIEKQYRTAVWDGLYANVSYFCMQFSDHPHSGNPSIIPSFKDINHYILSYIERFGLGKHMHLSTQVTLVKQLVDDKRWNITALNLETNESFSQTFDFLIIASGLHAKPRIPQISNMNKFSGLILHGSQFELNDQRLKDKQVVVVGHSHSATDISANCVGTAAKITNLFRRPYLVTPRLVRFKSELNKHKKNSFHIVPNDFLTFRRESHLMTTLDDLRKYNREHSTQINVEQTSKQKSHPDLYYDSEAEFEIREAISDNYYGFVKKGLVEPKKGNMQKFETYGITLDDGSFLKADVVIMCTGFDVTIEYFEQETLECLEYDKNDYKCPYLNYKCTFNPNLENMAMICQNEGLYFTCTELQSMWTAKVFSGKIKLPNRELMELELNEARERRKQNLNLQYPIPFDEIMDALAAEAGVLPDFNKLKENSPELYDMVWNNAAISSIFLLGNEEKKEEAIKVIKQMDYLMKKEYLFNDSDSDETELPSIQLLGKILQENNDFTVPRHIFKV